MLRIAPWLSIALIAAGSAPPCPPADGGRPQPQLLEMGFNTFPPCIDVEWAPVDIEGRPPLTFTWKVDEETVATSESWIMDTGDYSGFHTVAATVTNPWGSATASSFFIIGFILAASVVMAFAIPLQSPLAPSMAAAVPSTAATKSSASLT